MAIFNPPVAELDSNPFLTNVMKMLQTANLPRQQNVEYQKQKGLNALNEALLPYVGQKEQAALQSTLISNALNQRKNQYPGLGEGGLIGELAYLKYLKDQQGGNNGGELEQLNGNQQSQINQQFPEQTSSNTLNANGLQGVIRTAQGPQGDEFKQQLTSLGGPQQAIGQGQQPIGLRNASEVSRAGGDSTIDLLTKSVMADIASKQALAQNRQTSGSGNVGVGLQQIKGLERQLSLEHPEWDENKINQVTSAYLNGSNTLPDGTKLPKPSGLADTLLSEIRLKSNTAQGANQQRFAATVDSQIREAQRYAPIISEYSGIQGAAKLKADAIRSGLGENVPSYTDYAYFRDQLVPSIAGEMMRALGVNASDTQKELYKQVVDPISWDKNPEAALKNFNRLNDFFKQNVSKVLSKSVNEIKSDLKEGSKEQKELNYDPTTGRWS